MEGETQGSAAGVSVKGLHIKLQNRAGKLDEWVKELAAKFDNLSSVPEIRMEKGEARPPQVVL